MILIVVSKFIVYISLVLVGIWCFNLWKTRRIRLAVSHLYSLKYKPLPFIGHFYHLINKDWVVSTSILLDTIWDVVDRHVKTACVWAGPFPVVAVCGAEDVKKVLNSTATKEKSDEYNLLKAAVGNGLITAPNHIWKITRVHADPLFHPRNVEQLMPFFNQNCREMVKSMSARLDSAAFNVNEYTLQTALKSVCQLIYGPEFDIDINSQVFKRILRMLERIPEIFQQRITKPWLWFECIFNYVHRKDLEELNNLIKVFVDERLKEPKTETLVKTPKEQVNEEGSDEISSSTNRALSLVDTHRNMQKHEQGFTDQDLKHEMCTLIVTGTDTTGGTVAACLVALAQYPDVQDKLYDEIASVVDQDEITMEDIRKMQYLDQVCNEILRINTIIPIIGRKCSEDLKLSECTVPAGSTVYVMLAGMHMNTKVFSNPKKFEPEHFSPGNCIGREKNFLPFSAGPRSCIAKIYTQVLIKLMLVHILRLYRVSTNMDIHRMKKRWAMMLKAAEGYNIKLHKRQKPE